MKSIRDLLIDLENHIKNTGTIDGLCTLAVNIFSTEKAILVIHYIRMNRPRFWEKGYVLSQYNSPYFWKPGLIQPRLDFLRQHIAKLKQ